jgi:hypothetical protein
MRLEFSLKARIWSIASAFLLQITTKAAPKASHGSEDVGEEMVSPGRYATTRGRMTIRDTFTEVPLSVCYPRLNSTLPLDRTITTLDGVEMHDPCASVDSQSLDLVNKAEGLGLRSAVSFLLVE